MRSAKDSPSDRREQKAITAGYTTWLQALEQTAHLSLREAAQALGVSRSTMWSERQRLGVSSRWAPRPFDPDDATDTRHSAYGYRALGCRCQICTQDHARSHRAWKAQARTYEQAYTHGITGYSNYGCRCPKCLLAHAEHRALSSKRSAAQRP